MSSHATVVKLCESFYTVCRWAVVGDTAAAAAAADDDDGDDDVNYAGQHLTQWLFQPRWHHAPTVAFVWYGRLLSGVPRISSGAVPMSTLFHVSKQSPSQPRIELSKGCSEVGVQSFNRRSIIIFIRATKNVNILFQFYFQFRDNFIRQWKLF